VPAGSVFEMSFKIGWVMLATIWLLARNRCALLRRLRHESFETINCRKLRRWRSSRERVGLEQIDVVGPGRIACVRDRRAASRRRNAVFVMLGFVMLGFVCSDRRRRDW
jgi:hypothetical protein